MLRRSISTFILTLTVLSPIAISAICIPNTTSTPDLQSLLTTGGAGYILSLCVNQVYTTVDTLNFTSPNQEISTETYPTDSSRAIIFVNGSTANDGTAHTTAISGNCGTCDGISVRNIQVDGNRGDGPILSGGGNLEIGGAVSSQLVEYVHSHNPRGWSCLHIAEGPFTCRNSTIRYNDIGPCGSDSFQQWSDGISLSCSSSDVYGNVVTDPTDGGIVIFGAPGSTIRNNTIRVTDRVLLGGINMVDYLPWDGNYSDVLVDGNRIYGGFADTYGNNTFGSKNSTALIKIGTAIGPQVWFNQEYGTNLSTGPVTVSNNVYSGAMNFGIAIASAANFALLNNTIVGNSTFSGNYGVNCTGAQLTPHPPTAYIIDSTLTTNNVTIDNSNQYVNGTADGLTCFTPVQIPGQPDYPYGPDFDWAALAGESSSSSSSSSSGMGGSATASSVTPSPTKKSGSSKSGRGGESVWVWGVMGIAVLSATMALT